VISIPFNFIIHLKPSLKYLATKIFDLSEKKRNLPVSTLSVAKQPKFVMNKPPKALFLVSKGTFQNPCKPLKRQFSFSIENRILIDIILLFSRMTPRL
jgi:hypothetical protein